MKKVITITLDYEIIDYLNKQKKIKNRSTSNLIETILLEHIRGNEIAN